MWSGRGESIISRSKTPPVGPIKAIVFDLFGVLVSFDDEIVYRRIAGHCANPATLDCIRGLVSNDDLIRGRLSLAQLHEQLVDAYGLVLDLSDFEALWLRPYSAPEPGMAELVRSLAKYYRLVLLSNVDHDYWQMLRQSHSELDLFDSCLLSWELGEAKPAPTVFARAVAAADAPPSACLVIDDKVENVEAARLAGLRAHLYVGIADLRAALSRMGVGG
jgi:HAD superfamily hydrolase (TIGR01509 family)